MIFKKYMTEAMLDEYLIEERKNLVLPGFPWVGDQL